MKSIIIFFIFLAAFPLFSDSLLLKNGHFFKGSVTYFDLDKIVFKTDNNYIIYHNSVQYLIIDYNNDKYFKITFDNKPEKTYYAKFIKSSDKNIFAFYSDLNTDFFVYNNKSFSSIIFEKESDNKRYKNSDALYDLYDINNFNKLIDSLPESKDSVNKSSFFPYSSDMYLNKNIDIRDINFYENYWNMIQNFINSDVKESLWNLLEQYSDKEKLLNQINNEYYTVSENKSSDDILKNDLIKLRKEFYYRTINVLVNKNRSITKLN